VVRGIRSNSTTSSDTVQPSSVRTSPDTDSQGRPVICHKYSLAHSMAAAPVNLPLAASPAWELLDFVVRVIGGFLQIAFCLAKGRKVRSGKLQ
jgi:hypothetical protein